MKAKWLKILFGIVGVSFAGVFLLLQTRTGFFFFSGQHRIDFASATGVYDPQSKMAVYEGATVFVPSEEAEDIAVVLGESSGNKRIEVDISNQRLYAYEGGSRVYDFVISTGKPWWATPTGNFKFWTKLRYTRMRGGSRALGTYYDLPNVPFTMFYAGSGIPTWKGYAIHGTYWHNNFGHPMSHGCVNLTIPDAEKLFYWSTLDTPITIYGTTPAG